MTLVRESSALHDIVNRFQVREALECRAVYRAAVSPSRDLRAARALLSSLGDVIEHPDRAAWNRLEVQFHRALHDEGGNPVLADLTEQTHLDVQSRCVRRLRVAPYGPESLRFLQAQHRLLLEAIECGDSQAAIDHARSHVCFVRDSIVAVLSN
jgi:GntR family transcriptional repressor for pyruvate dehydrogenase complex